MKRYTLFLLMALVACTGCDQFREMLFPTEITETTTTTETSTTEGWVTSYGGTPDTLSSAGIKAMSLGQDGQAWAWVDAVEISKDLQSWNMISDPGLVKTFEVKTGQKAKLHEKKQKTNGTYHGVKVTLAPKCRIKWMSDMDWSTYPGTPVWSDITFDRLPDYLYVATMSGWKCLWSPTTGTKTSTIELSSNDGSLIPFTVNSEEETNILVEWTVDVNSSFQYIIKLTARQVAGTPANVVDADTAN